MMSHQAHINCRPVNNFEILQSRNGPALSNEVDTDREKSNIFFGKK